jgi:tRNA-2-methylthio-N6-dimethylallyladenosine synthase
MKRGYSKEWFLDRIEKLRAIPDITISTDIIVGFPGESEEDFADTIDVVEKSQFEQMFSFVYSPRPHTEAAEYSDQVDKEVAKTRLHKLQALQREILEKQAKNQIGKTYKVLVERYENGKIFGKSDNFYSIEANGDESLLGKIVDVKIKESRHSTLIGEL